MSTRGLRLLFVTERYPPLAGGMAQSAARQVMGLRRTSDLDVVLFLHKEGAPGVTTKVRDGGTDYLITHDGQVGSAAQRAWSTVQREHAARPYDLVIGFGCNQPGMIATTFATWLNVPSLVSVRGNDFDRDWNLDHKPKEQDQVNSYL